MNTSRMRVTIAVLALILALVAQSTSAHTHTIDPDGDGEPLKKGNGETVYLANGVNHEKPVFTDDGTGSGGSVTICDLESQHPGSYGIETAHHGPDTGQPGNSDRCFETTYQGSQVPASMNDSTPAIN
jgi:hypothetical protein